jgi:death on curing protein
VNIDDVVFLYVEDVDAAHDGAIAEFGGAAGVRDRGLIESAVTGSRAGYYDTFAQIAAAYVYRLTKNHGYVDGNKRTAALALRMFLRVNGFPFVLGPEWEHYIEAVAAGTMSFAELVTRIVALIGSDVAIQVNDA